jgi:hypothetical protein
MPFFQFKDDKEKTRTFFLGVIAACFFLVLAVSIIEDYTNSSAIERAAKSYIQQGYDALTAWHLAERGVPQQPYEEKVRDFKILAISGCLFLTLALIPVFRSLRYAIQKSLSLTLPVPTLLWCSPFSPLSTIRVHRIWETRPLEL